MDGAERQYMYELDFEQEENYSVTKSHEEILRLIEEIKTFEEKFPEYYVVERTETEEELIDIEKDGEHFTEFGQGTMEFIEVDPDVVEFVEVGTEFESVSFEQETEKQGLKDSITKSKFFKIKARGSTDVKKVRLEQKAATFKLRFDEKGKLVNLDFKTPKPSEPKSESKKRFKLPIPKRKGKSKEGETKTTEKKSKGLKGKLGKIGNLKKVIPSKGKKEKKREE
ncbi:MAG: hypothetical protein KAW45_05230 [Thermoplasmatales archaeon]|nr:hypothetical protein [Thermoplasmatales archaeon]